MTDIAATSIDRDVVTQKYALRDVGAAPLIPENSARLFAFPACTHITRVTVMLDGESDSSIRPEQAQHHGGCHG